MKMSDIKPPDISSMSCGSHLLGTMTLNDNKAGMEGLDKEKINQIIYEASKGSKFFESEQRKEEQLTQKIKEQQAFINSLSPTQLLNGLTEADEIIHKLKAHQDLSHTIVHVDMDAFYAAVEMRDDPSLINKPMAVGGMGMLSTSNYIARRFGVRAAMPGFIGLKLCPDLVLVRPNFRKYTAVSQEIRTIFAQYDANFSPMSLDEAYIDLTEHLNLRNASTEVSRLFLLRVKSEDKSISLKKSFCSCDLNAVLRPSVISLNEITSCDSLQDMLNILDIRDLNLPTVCNACNKKYPPFFLKLYGKSSDDAVLEMRNRIEERTFLTASAGIAPNTMLAKVCSDKNKPNGQFHLLADANLIEVFIKNLPIRKIPGIGKVTEKLLGAINVTVCSDLFKQRAVLYHTFSPVSFQYFMRIALGMGSTFLEREEERKSLSTERTFTEINEPSQLFEKCAELCQCLTKDLQNEQLLGKTVSIKIKIITFEVKTRSHTLQFYTDDEKIILKAAKQLLKTEIDAVKPNLLRLRLMGVRISKLKSKQGGQASILNMFNSHAIKDPFCSSKFPTDVPCLLKMVSCQDYTATNSNDCLFEISDDSSSNDTHFQQSLQDSKGVTIITDSSSMKKSSNLDNKSCILNFVNKIDKNKCTEAAFPDQADEKEKLFDAKIKDNFSNQNTFFDLKDNWSTKLSTACSVDSDLESVACSVIQNAESSISCPENLITCPICGQQKSYWPLDKLNKHIDLCLSKKTIKNILQEELNSDSLKAQKRNADTRGESSQGDSKKRKTLFAYFK